MKFILPTQSKQKYVLDLLKSNSSIGDMSFVYLSVYLNTLHETQSDALWFKCARVLNDLSNRAEINILKQVLKFPITVDQIIAFIQTMADEGWTLLDLPQRSDKERELHFILGQLMEIADGGFRQWAVFESMKDVSTVNVLDHFYTHPIQQRLKKAEAKGLKRIEIPTVKDVERHIRFANNPRSEAQAAVQCLLSDEIPYEDQSIVCLDPHLMDQVESFLIESGIPYQKAGHGSTHPVFRLYKDLLAFKQNPSLESLIPLIHNDGLVLPYKLSLLTYLETFNPEVDALLAPLNHASNCFENPLLGELLNKDSYLNLEKEAEWALSAIREDFSTLLKTQTSTIESTVSLCFDVMTSILAQDDAHLPALYSLKDLLEASQLSEMEGIESWLDHLIHRIDQLTLSTKAQTGVILTDLAHAFIPGLKRQIWLGCTQAHYPQFKTHGGLFDDEYFSGIQTYDLKTHYQYHMSQLDRLQSISPILIYSYALGSYEGKAQKMPYELESFLKGKAKSSKWPLAEKELVEKPGIPQLDPAISEALFIKDGLQGSVSAFDKFFHCPYQFFLYRGMKLKDEEDLSFNQIVLGKLMHALMDHALKTYHKNYAQGLMANLNPLVERYMEALHALFPKDEELLHLIELKTLETLKSSLAFLKDREAHTPFEPAASELPFELDYLLLNGATLRLKGGIDRVDTHADGFAVIDYKSSPKNFSETKFMAGLKLQLPTYVWAYQQLSGLKPQGAFYFSLSPEPTTLVNDAAFDLRKEELKKRRMNGFILEPNPDLDANGEHIVSFSTKKDGTIGMPKPLDLPSLMRELNHLYTSLYEDLKAGRIPKQNKDDVCAYCPYKGFCQYKKPKMRLENYSSKNSKLKELED